MSSPGVSLRLLTALYATQFIGVGFLSVGLVAILRADGVSLSTLGLIQLLGLVWPLKFLWAPLLDRFTPASWSPRFAGAGHYRAWLLLLQPLMVFALLGLALVSRPSEQLPLLVAVVGLFIIMSATQDIAADALSVRGLAGGRRDLGSAVQVSASYVGNLVGGAGAVIVADHWGLRAAAVLLALTTAVALIPVITHREAEHVVGDPATGVASSEADSPAGPRSLGDFFGVFASAEARAWCFVAMPLLYMGSAGAYSLVTPALTDSGRSLSEVGLITLTWASLPAIAAGLLAGWISAKWGRRAGVGLGIAVLAAGVWGLGPVFAGGGSFTAAAAGVGLLLSGYTVLNVTVYAQALRFARPDHAGSDFTLLTCIPLALSFLAAWAVLTLAQAAGYGAAAWVSFAVAALGALTAWRGLGRAAG
ncbi:MFS transporter [Falsarthrobacter nasiphocae]|uniref:MFS family arabinose efflux permease n=1 Tax=Falsarthrobacter nasiphocae TaxID=189863 RepID=A0AAE3YH09_9MICC|nr:MFS transporter [Falsarthrobacter nasiphocae]MDR6892025.1 putative MFS family arabinose efflux permease [Falsarthrobacter nasiphocae]